MRNLLFFVFGCILFSSVWTSCNNSKTYAELLKDEQNAISKFINDSNFTVLYSYPKDSIFLPNEFVKLPNGLYMNVIDRGNGSKIDSGQNVLMRVKYYRNLFDTTTYHSSNWSSGDPSQFVFGQASSSNNYVEGFATPLIFVRGNAKVRLIIPSSLNDYTTVQNVTPYYYYVQYSENVMGY